MNGHERISKLVTHNWTRLGELTQHRHPRRALTTCAGGDHGSEQHWSPRQLVSNTTYTSIMTLPNYLRTQKDGARGGNSTLGRCHETAKDSINSNHIQRQDKRFVVSWVYQLYEIWYVALRAMLLFQYLTLHFHFSIPVRRGMCLTYLVVIQPLTIYANTAHATVMYGTRSRLGESVS